jgi:hypothetical protein
MAPAPKNADHPIRTITVDDRKYSVALRVGFDGVEHVGRLWFTDTVTGVAYQDHGAIPGISTLDAVRKAKEFNETEVEQRCYRALSEKRRFSKLRGATDKIIEKIKYLNRVAIGLEKGIIDRDGGKQELDQIQGQLLEIVQSLRTHAGVEDEEKKKK